MRTIKNHYAIQKKDPAGYNEFVISFICQGKKKLPEKIKGMLFDNKPSIIDTFEE